MAVVAVDAPVMVSSTWMRLNAASRSWVNHSRTSGSDNSSATNGSSVTKVAGKKRWPEKPCPKATDADKLVHAAYAAAAQRNFRVMIMPCHGKAPS